MTTSANSARAHTGSSCRHLPRNRILFSIIWPLVLPRARTRPRQTPHSRFYVAREGVAQPGSTVGAHEPAYGAPTLSSFFRVFLFLFFLRFLRGLLRSCFPSFGAVIALDRTGQPRVYVYVSGLGRRRNQNTGFLFTVYCAKGWRDITNSQC